MKLRQVKVLLALLILSCGSVFAQKLSPVYPGGIRYMTLAHDGLPSTADKTALATAMKQRKTSAATTNDYPYPVQMYDYVDYCWIPDTASNVYSEDDELLWNLPQFSFYNFHKPSYGVGCGAFIEDGKMHTFVSDFSKSFMGVYRFDMVTYNADNMQVISHKSFESTDLNNLCLAQCQYPLDEKKGIGIFYNTKTEGEDWVIMDYEDMSLKRIATCNRNYGIIVSDGTFLYGWCEDNCIYKIDPSTFKTTKIGAHGFKQYITQANGQAGAYVQSATFDKNTKTCYWGAFNAQSGESGFYKVNLETAKIEKVLDTYVSQHLGMCTAPTECDDNVPGPVTDLTLDIVAPSRTGTASFTMPTLNYKGDKQLEESLSYRVTQGTTIIDEAENKQPGEAITINLSLRKDGNYTITLETKNSVGWSPKTNARIYIGYDTPVAPPSATLTIAKDGTANLHWTKPEKGTHEGFLGSLTYDVYRIHGKQMELVALGVTDTVFSEKLTVGAITSYQYAVIADNEGHQSEFCYSNAYACGKAYDCPVVVDFTDQDVFNVFRVKDANEDNYSWAWDNDRDYLGYARYRYNGQMEGDDWLFSPSINMEAGRTYKLTYTARCVTMSLPERLSIALGKDAAPEAMTQIIVKRRDLPASKRQSEVSFTVKEDGEYYLGFHACSDANELDLMLSGFRIDVEPLNDAPAAVEDFSCIAGDKGDTNATISFKAPTKSEAGTAQDNISKIIIERDNNTVKTWENVKAGEDLEFFDNVGITGYHDWVVYAVEGTKRGDYKEKKLYLGYDVPAQVENAYIKDYKTSLEICWNPVTTGAHGGYVDPEGITYEVRNNSHQIQTTTKDNTVTLSCKDTDEEEQTITYYRIYSINSNGYVECAESETMLIGPISPLPFVDSAASGKSGQIWWQYNDVNSTSYVMGIGTGASSDGDNACFGWNCYSAGDNFHFRTTKLDFSNVTNPVLKFDIAAFVPDFNITVSAITPDHEVIYVDAFDLAVAQMGNWGTVGMELPKELANYRYCIIDFHISGTKDNAWLYMDNVNIFDDNESGITDINSNSQEIQCFDIAGRRIGMPEGKPSSHHGIYVINGKKVIR